MLNIIWGNIKIISVMIIIMFAINSIPRSLYNSLKIRFSCTKFGKNLIETPIPKLINSVIFPIFFIALCTALQQKYSIFDLGKSEDYLTLVISILTLYGILYTFLQFTVSHAQQNTNDKYWGRSITQGPLIRRLKFNVFNSSFFKILLIYSIIYPISSKVILSKWGNLGIYNGFLLDLWNVSVVIIYSLYVYLFIKSLNGIRILQSIQENRRSGLHLEIERVIAEEYQQVFAYSYKYNENYFLNKLLKELHYLEKNEQNEMIMHIINTVTSSFYERNPVSKLRKLSRILIRNINEYDYRPIYMYRMFTELFKGIEKENIEIDFENLLIIYTQAHDVIYQILIDSNKNESIIFEIVNIYSSHNSWFTQKYEGCTYFQLPSVIKKSICSYKDIELIHRYIKRTKGYEFIDKCNLFKLEKEERDFVKSYSRYIYTLLDCYKVYLDELNKDNYSEFWRLFDSYKRREVPNQERDYIKYISSIIYKYIIQLEYEENNKRFIRVLLGKLEYKYKVAFIFYNMLYTGPSWEWKSEILYFRQIIESSWDNANITDDDVVKFVCNKIKSSNIGHRIEPELVKWIIQHIEINKLTEEIVEKCSSDKYISYATLLKLNFIFLERRSYYPINFYNSDFNHAELNGWNWETDFFREMLKTPHILKEGYFSQHLFSFCKKVSYSKDYFVIENDFKVFFINPYFNISENEFDELVENGSREGIIEFLILNLYKSDYRYLLEGNRANQFFTRVEKIIDRKNKSVEDYVMELVLQTNSIVDNGLAIPMTKQHTIIKLIKNFFDSQVC